ncbi:hypothetical protein QUF80_08830 [Desulfococcaceae bacterium HSG8]|nr:hypothetical protein [Desulfococcaceae bacterium HSG8]
MNPIEYLSFADPELAVAVETALKKKFRVRGSEFKIQDLKSELEMLAEDAVWGLSQETSLGKAIAMGYVELIGEADQEQIREYRRLVCEAGENNGPTLGRIMATYLVPVVKNRCIEDFMRTIDIMLTKGIYTLKPALECLSSLSDTRDFKSVPGYLGLLRDAFSHELSYNQSLHLSHIIPKAVLSLSPPKRCWQVGQFRRIIRADFQLADPFLDGMAKGLHLLSKNALPRFVTLGLEKFSHNESLGTKFLSLVSELGVDAYTGMVVTVSLSQVRQQLNRYLRARIGVPISVRSLSTIRGRLSAAENAPWVCSDGKFIYLPDEIDWSDLKEENMNFYKCLTKLESAYYEFDTFDFDFEKATERAQQSLNHSSIFLSGNPSPAFLSVNPSPAFLSVNPSPSFLSGNPSPVFLSVNPSPPFLKGAGGISACEGNPPRPPFKKGGGNTTHLSDMERFFLLFPEPELASDLFTIFEHGRIRLMLLRFYPGIIRQSFPVLRREAMRIFEKNKSRDALSVLYARIGLGISTQKFPNIDDDIKQYVEIIAELSEKRFEEDQAVETCAELIFRTYHDAEMLCIETGSEGRLRTPFSRKLRPDLYFSTFRNIERIAETINIRLGEKGVTSYKSDIRKHLIENDGDISPEDIREIILHPQGKTSEPENTEHQTDFSWLDLSEILGKTEVSVNSGNDGQGPVSWYREWDCELGDYLNDHVRVCDRFMATASYEGKADFYQQTMARHRGLVRKIRHAFELLKPAELTILRQWIEGDEFDYRALLDFAMDKKAGITPSERLYIKRLKQQRDVAVLLLTDISRSTSNEVSPSSPVLPGGEEGVSVLDVEKQAIVLFCEALEVVGDAFAIAGFSGTGRLGVDYFRIKDFDETMDDTVRQRIDAMSPQRSTRMGAAIRHAVSQLEKICAKVRLLIILGDGFPNDTGYKREYAIEDTRRAIFEARSVNIYARAITVNLAGDSRLDDLYGSLHHNVISDVRELPDKLLRIYSALTR